MVAAICLALGGSWLMLILQGSFTAHAVAPGVVLALAVWVVIDLLVETTAKRARTADRL